MLRELSVRDRAMVMLAGSTGIRRSELMALGWADLNLDRMEVGITRSCYRNHIGDTKTEASRRPVPLHPLVLEALLDWKQESALQSDSAFLFQSIRLMGTKPLSPDSILKKSIRPALARAEIVGKVIGWHSLRHTFGTLLRTLSVEIKTAQDLLRHSSSRLTLDLYSHAVSPPKRDANNKLV